MDDASAEYDEEMFLFLESLTEGVHIGSRNHKVCYLFINVILLFFLITFILFNGPNANANKIS